MRRLLADVRPLQNNPQFRRLWLGWLISSLGSTMTTFAVALQVYRITHSSAVVGAIGVAYAVPAIVVGLGSGVLVDTVDRRRIVVVTSCLSVLVSAVFAVQAWAGWNQVWLLVVLSAGQGAIGAVHAPAQRTFMPRLLATEQIAAGAALIQLCGYLALVAGPVLAGFVTAAGGLRACYLVDVLSFAAPIYAYVRLGPIRPDRPTPQRSVTAAREGLTFIVRSHVLLGALLTDIGATVLAMPVALFPAVNAERFGGSPRTLGLLSAAVAIGGLVGTALSGPVAHIDRPGRAMLITAALWGAALAGFGAVHALVPTLALLAAAGGVDTFTVVFRSAIVQIATPDRLRGRVNATEFISGVAFPQLGNFRAGVVASAFSPTISAVSGGLSAIAASAIIAVTLPSLARYRTNPQE
jgi:predicted MFS family arabinose efflux permease